MPKFARFDHAAPSPSPVIGWYDTDAIEYPTLPDKADLLPMTEGEWAVRMERFYAVKGKGTAASPRLLVALDPPAQSAMPYDVPKLLAVERIGAAGKLRAVRAMLKMSVPDAELSDAELLLRDRWDAARVLASDDGQVRSLLAKAGCDPDVILAMPTAD